MTRDPRAILLLILVLALPLWAQDPPPAEGPRIEVAALRCRLAPPESKDKARDDGVLAGLEFEPMRRILAPREEASFALGSLEYTLRNLTRDGGLQVEIEQLFSAFGHHRVRRNAIFADASARAGYFRAGVLRVRAPRRRGTRGESHYLVFVLGSSDAPEWGEVPKSDEPAEFLAAMHQMFVAEPTPLTASNLLDLAALVAAPPAMIDDIERAAARLTALEENPEGFEDVLHSLPGILNGDAGHRLERALIRAGQVPMSPDWRALADDEEHRIPRSSHNLYRAYVHTALPANARLMALGRLLAREDSVEDLDRWRHEIEGGLLALDASTSRELVTELEARTAGRHFGELIPLALAGFLIFACGALGVRAFARRLLHS
jgi:hypothetical protein